MSIRNVLHLREKYFFPWVTYLELKYIPGMSLFKYNAAVS